MASHRSPRRSPSASGPEMLGPAWLTIQYGSIAAPRIAAKYSLRLR
jgi:hypothetical protein